MKHVKPMTRMPQEAQTNLNVLLQFMVDAVGILVNYTVQYVDLGIQYFFQKNGGSL